MSEKPIIEVENLSFTYHPPEWIFENLNFTIYSGEICALVGPSGTGKTTLGYILKGLIPHAIKGTLKGNVIVAGLDLQKASLVTTAKSIGMVFQDLNAQLFNLTVQEEIEFGLRNLRLPLEWAKEAMNLLSLEELAQRNPLNLSAGQKQRVILASIIAIHPRVLILDEPSAHLDHQSRVQLKNWLLQLQTDQQMTIILIEQDPWLVGELCQRYFFLKDAMLQEVMKEDLLEQTPQWAWKW